MLRTRLEIASRISSYELAFRMQMAAPELLDFSKESPETLAMYGVDQEPDAHARHLGRSHRSQSQTEKELRHRRQANRRAHPRPETAGACSIARWSCGVEDSDGLRWWKSGTRGMSTTPAAITTRWLVAFSWPAAESKADRL
jgi:hypothetical protein